MKTIDDVNSRIQTQPKLRSLLISQECIKNRINVLAQDIARDMKDSPHIDILLVLTGSFMFTADLSRALYNCSGKSAIIHCIKTSVYDETIKDSGDHYRAVTLELSPKHIENRDILLIEDIADQGFTLSWLKHYLMNTRKAKSLTICSLLYKRLDNPTHEVRNIRRHLEINYIGFTVPDVWVAGYGIDAAHEFRHLPCIVRVNEDYFK